MEEIVAWRAAVDLLLEQFLQSLCLYLACRRREDDAFAFLYRHLEITRNVKVLVGSVSTFLLLGIFNAPIPVGLENKLVFLAELHIEIRISCIHACAYTIVHFLVSTACRRVLVRELTHASESHKRTETQSRGRMGVDKRISQQDTVFIVLEHYFLF